MHPKFVCFLLQVPYVVHTVLETQKTDDPTEMTWINYIFIRIEIFCLGLLLGFEKRREEKNVESDLVVGSKMPSNAARHARVSIGQFWDP